jgi:hypothetical protein
MSSPAVKGGGALRPRVCTSSLPVGQNLLLMQLLRRARDAVVTDGTQEMDIRSLFDRILTISHLREQRIAPFHRKGSTPLPWMPYEPT